MTTDDASEDDSRAGAAGPVGDTLSPCIGVCRLDPATGRCLGCRRTIAEIAAWSGLSPRERAAIVARLRESAK
ncbi:MAG TPA: DUF1289 domain-containing protein [Alphaproteobacteria bacterium]|nr:DUF1289 domain-containing protein [Alphaproteobacteria bacterium]